MNKKFLSVALFGALLVASAGTFTSCKDYDDDIDAVNGRIDELVKSLSDLQTQVGGFVKSVDYNESTGVLTVVGADNKSHTYTVGKALPSYTLEVTADGKVILKKDGTTVSTGDIKFPTIPTPAPAFDPSKLTIGTDGVIKYDGSATGVTIPKSTSGTMVAIKDGDATIGYTITMGQESAQFYVVDAMPLKGLVIKPECYVGGIPSVLSSNVAYTKWTTGAYDMTRPSKDGETYSIVANTPVTYITPQIWAYYHMNPASVTMNQIAAMSFISDDKEYYPVSRASQLAPVANLEKSSVETVDNQRYLKVAMDAKAENIAGAGKVSVYALQVTTKKVGNNDAKVITSDYGSIHKSVITDLYLTTKVGASDVRLYGQKLTRAGADNTLAGHAKEAIDAPKDYTVATDGTIELYKLINAYATIDGGATPSKINVKDLGMKYVYTASNYITGGNETPQNEFFNMADAKKGIVNPEYKGADAENTEGREPLIRVELVDTTKANNPVVAVGWIKTAIIKGTTGGFEKVFPQGTYYYGCDDFTGSLNVINMNDVYKEAKMSKEDFHAAYVLKTDAGNVVLADGSTGIVTTKPDAGSTTTFLLDWTVTPGEVLALSATTSEMFATVTYESKDGTRNDITITFKATIVMPSGVIGDAQKITQYWDPNKKFLKLDVKEPIATAANEFVAQMYSFFEGNKITVDGVNTAFTSFAAANLKSKFVFAITDATKTVKVGSDTYTLSVKTNGNNSELWAAKGTAAAELVATINGDMTAATNGVLTYNIAGTNAKVLLNKSAYNVAPFTAAVKIVVTNDCDEVLPLTNDVFDVKFLRPINANDKETATLQDATTAGAKIDMSQLMNLTDWRGKDFALTPADFYNYYGVTGITIDKAKIMTNMNQTGDTKKLLSEVTTKIDINYTYALNKSATPVTYGDLTYYNNSGTVTSSFKLYIPVTVKYTFGEVTANVTLTITPTH